MIMLNVGLGRCDTNSCRKRLVTQFRAAEEVISTATTTKVSLITHKD